MSISINDGKESKTTASYRGRSQNLKNLLQTCSESVKKGSQPAKPKFNVSPISNPDSTGTSKRSSVLDRNASLKESNSQFFPRNKADGNMINVQELLSNRTTALEVPYEEKNDIQKKLAESISKEKDYEDFCRSYLKDYSTRLQHHVKQKLSYSLAFEIKKILIDYRKQIISSVLENVKSLQQEFVTTIKSFPDLPQRIRGVLSNVQGDFEMKLEQVQQALRSNVKDQTFLESYYIQAQELDSLLAKEVEEKFSDFDNKACSSTEREGYKTLRAELLQDANSIFGGINSIVSHEFSKMNYQFGSILAESVDHSFKNLLESLRTSFFVSLEQAELPKEIPSTRQDTVRSERIMTSIEVSDKQTQTEEEERSRTTEPKQKNINLTFQRVGVLSVETPEQVVKMDMTPQIVEKFTQETQTDHLESPEKPQITLKQREFGTELSNLIVQDTQISKKQTPKSLAECRVETFGFAYNTQQSIYPCLQSNLENIYAFGEAKEEITPLNENPKKEVEVDLDPDQILSNIENMSKQLDNVLSKRRPHSDSKNSLKLSECTQKPLNSHEDTKAATNAQPLTDKDFVSANLFENHIKELITQPRPNIETLGSTLSSNGPTLTKKPISSIKNRFNRNEQVVSVRVIDDGSNRQIHNDVVDNNEQQSSREPEPKLSVQRLTISSLPLEISGLSSKVEESSPYPRKQINFDSVKNQSPTSNAYRKSKGARSPRMKSQPGTDEDYRKVSLYTEDFHVSEILEEDLSKLNKTGEYVDFNQNSFSLLEENKENTNLSCHSPEKSADGSLQQPGQIACEHARTFSASKGKFFSPYKTDTKPLTEKIAVLDDKPAISKFEGNQGWVKPLDLLTSKGSLIICYKYFKQ